MEKRETFFSYEQKYKLFFTVMLPKGYLNVGFFFLKSSMSKSVLILLVLIDTNILMQKCLLGNNCIT